MENVTITTRPVRSTVFSYNKLVIELDIENIIPDS